MTPPPPEHRRPMLIDINLLPAEVWRPPIRISLFSVTLVILALIGGYLLFPFAILAQYYQVPELSNVYQLWQQQQDDVASLEATLAAKQAYLVYLVGQAGIALALQNQIDELEGLLNAMSGDYQVLSDGTVTWSEVLTRIKAVAPSGIYLTSIAQGSEVSIKGTADSDRDVSLFAVALRNTELFSQVFISEMTCVSPTPTPTPTPMPTPTPTPPVGRCTFTITATLSGGSQ